MKKTNLFAMSLLATTAAFTLNSCSNDDTIAGTASTPESVDSFYMTLQVKGSANSTVTRTEQKGDPNKEDGSTEESTINNGTIYIYKDAALVFTKAITSADWKTAPTQTTTGTTNPIKVSVNSVTENTNYNVYFLANNNETPIADPINNDALFNVSTKGGEDYAYDNKFVMFNQNDKSNAAAHSTVTFSYENKSENKPAEASTIYLDRVVARIDKPTVTATAITTPSSETATTKTKHIDYIANVSYVNYAVSNLNNHSYVMQNWTDTDGVWTLNTAGSTYFKDYATYGTTYEAKGLGNFGEEPKNYMFENTTNDTKKATAMYFRIKANLTEEALENSDFKDGTFYRYDNRMYTKIEDILKDTEVAYPFIKVDENTKATTAMEPAEVLAKIQGTDHKLIAEGTELANFRKTYNIEVYREGYMYYRYAISDNFYERTDYYSVLRNSIYRLTVDAIYDMGKDVPNGPTPDKVTPNYYMNVTVSINPWVLNTKTIQLQ